MIPIHFPDGMFTFSETDEKNPLVSDNEKYMVLQFGKTGDQAGVGNGIFIYAFEEVSK